ncbi:MAG: hypothetical protein GF383_16380 [Candidatus Lokiarchaeota archaeon]|nr:hypothetical protein [Candidatus Lokiarchaeota archaeon]MBD3343338.1 hypothetical protein [Candidatus Lokiarchaeota archaeon]
MTEIEPKKSDTDVQEVKEEPITKRIYSPEFTLCVKDDSSGYTGEIYLPGADRDSIRLKLNESYLLVSGETDRVRYMRSFGFDCPIDPETAKATYKEGLLGFTVDFKEPELHTVDVDIE